MGSNFFRGRELGPVSGLAPNSTAGRTLRNDPVSNFLFGKQQEVLPTAGPYAGMAPTLAAANSGYATRANGQAGTTADPGTSPQLAATFGTPPPAAAAPPMAGAPSALTRPLTTSPMAGRGYYGQ